MKLEIITQLYKLLGAAVLLPVPDGQKGCKMRGWQKTTWEKTQTPGYQQQLCKHGNTGVLLGGSSADLISVDCDDDEFLEDFLAANPQLRSSLITKGRRGGNVWLRMLGDYPDTRKLTKDGQPWGEFRSNGAQTIIAGRHPEGQDYRMLHTAQPVEIHFAEIHWPAGVSGLLTKAQAREEGEGERRDSTSSLHSSSSSLPSPSSSPTSPSPPSPSSPSSLLHDIPSPEAIAALESFRQTHSHLYRLYDRLILPLLPLTEGSRNRTLTAEIAPRLFGAMCFRAAGTILGVLICANKLGGYPAAEAREKFARAWQGLESSWPEKLSPLERPILAAIQDHQCRETFRICRELAINASDDKFPPPNFYLSSESLAARLAMRLANGKPDSQTAWRVLRKLVRNFGILRSIDPGKAHGHKERGRAAVFAWCLPLPLLQPPTPAA